MAEQALYRGWRPLTFNEVVEQEHVTTALKQAIVSDNIAHAYLFTGTRGTGKTTMAKIMARAVNCLNPHEGNPCGECEICVGILEGNILDVSEIDAASNNSVDNIRQIIEESVFLPAVATYKVYIIDEVHMLSQGAFNALLKTLEEPPAHVIFILATTEPQRIPATILSRCQRYDFHRISDAGMAARLTQIAEQEKIRITEDGIQTICSLADGAMRDAISLLDQASVSFPDGADADSITSMAGEASPAELASLVRMMAEGRGGDLLLELDGLIRQGQDLTRLTHDLARTYRNLMIVHASRDVRGPNRELLRELIRGREEDIAELEQLAGYYSQPEVVNTIRSLATLASNLRWSTDPRTLLEIELLKLSGTRRKPFPTEQIQPKVSVTTTPDKQEKVVAPESEQIQPKVSVTTTPDKQEKVVAPESEQIQPKVSVTTTPDKQEKVVAPESEQIQPKVSVTTTPDKQEKVVAPESEQIQPKVSVTTTPDKQEKVVDVEKPEPVVSQEPEPDAERPLQKAATASEPAVVAEPTAVTEPTVQAEPLETAEPTPEPQLVHQTAANTAAVTALTSEEAADLWEAALEKLKDIDIFAFMFAKEADVQPGGEGLEITLSPGHEAHYNVLHSDRGAGPLRQALREAAGREISYNLHGPAADRPPETDWLESLVDTAQELGIPVEREE